MRCEAARRRSRSSATSIVAKRPYFQPSILPFHSSIISPHVLEQVEVLLGVAVSLFGGGSIAKIPRPAFISASLLAELATCRRYSSMSAVPLLDRERAVEGRVAQELGAHAR